MQSFIKLQNLLIDPKVSFEDFRSQLISSQINQFTYLCLLLNIAATIRRPNFNFEPYLILLSNFRNQPNFRSNSINYTGYKDKISILMNACEKSVSSTVAYLVNCPEIKLHYIDPNGLNAIFYAIKNSDQNEGVKILEILYERAPDMIDTVVNNGYSPLFMAVEKFRIRIVDFLLRNGVDPNQKLVSSGNTAMHQLVKISPKYCLDEVRKMIEIFLMYDFDLSVKNNMDKTVEQYAFELRFNLTEIIRQIRFNKPNSQFGFYSQENSTEAYSCSKLTTTNHGDLITTCNYSQVQLSQSYVEIDALSVSNKSLLSEINCIRHYEIQMNERQLSLDMNVNQSECNGQVRGFQDQLDQIEGKRIECHSHSDSPKSQFESEDLQNLIEETGSNLKIYREDSSIEDYSQSQDSIDSGDGEFVRIQLIDYQRIQREIIQQDQISQGTYISAWKQIEPFFMKLNQIISGLELNIQIVGSFATGLWTHLSDVDIALVAQNQNFVDFQRLLQKVYNKIKVRMYTMGIKQLSYNKASKIPSIKIQMDPVLFASRKIDIMICHKKNMAITYVSFIRESLSMYPCIRPLFFFLKKIIQKFNLHDPFNGGMKSYTIFLMLYQIIRTLQLTNLAEMLMKICLYYGFYHQFDYEIQCWPTVNNGSKQLQKIQHVAVLRLNIKDPLNPKNNMGGKNTDASRLKNLFRTVYYGICQKINSGTTLQRVLEMAELVVR